MMKKSDIIKTINSFKSFKEKETYLLSLGFSEIYDVIILNDKFIYYFYNYIPNKVKPTTIKFETNE